MTDIRGIDSSPDAADLFDPSRWDAPDADTTTRIDPDPDPLVVGPEQLHTTSLHKQPPSTEPSRTKRRAKDRRAAAATRRERRRIRREERPDRATRRSDRSARLALRGVEGNITRTQTRMTLWFVEPPGAWSMRPVAWQRRAIERHALVEAELAEQGITELHRRTVREAWPVTEWAQAHDEWASPLPDVAGAPSWGDHLYGCQSGLLETNTTLKRVYWGVPLSRRTVSGEVAERLLPALARFGNKGVGVIDAALQRELDSLTEEIETITRIMNGEGVRAQPATDRQMDHLLYRSATIGLPIPAQSPTYVAGASSWDESDLSSLLDAADLSIIPGDGYVEVSGIVDGQRYTRYVAVLTVGRMAPLPIPEQMLPWQVVADGFALPIEWSEKIRLRPAEQVRRNLQRQITKVMSQYRHYTVEHDEVPPDDLQEQLEAANGIKRQLDNDHSMLSSRVEGWWRMAVAGTSPKDLLDKVAKIREAYKPGVNIEHEDGQYRLLREFIPGEPLANTAHRRRMSIYAASAGMPSVSDRIGDRTGILVGETASISARPVCWDLHAAPERLDKSGYTPLVGIPGAGKTHYAGMMTYQAVRAGTVGVILDPSGPLSNLATLPELTPYTRVYELTSRTAAPGALNPYKVIVDPRRADYHDTDEGTAQYNADVMATRAERMEFIPSILKMMIPPSMANNEAADVVLGMASSEVGGDSNHTPLEMIAALRDIGTSQEPEYERAARNIANTLDQMRHLAEARIIFPAEGVDGWDELGEEQLTIITMPGLQVPPEGVDVRNWTPQQRLAVPLMHLAAWQANRLIYERPRRERKILFLDENKYLKSFGAGRTLNLRVQRDSRKFNTRALVASQLPGDHLGLSTDGDDASTLAFETIVGELGKESSAIPDALKLLRLPLDQGYEEILARLGNRDDMSLDPDALSGENNRPREFAFRMGDDLEVVRADWSPYGHFAPVIDALNSRPRSATAGRR